MFYHFAILQRQKQGGNFILLTPSHSPICPHQKQGGRQGICFKATRGADRNGSPLRGQRPPRTRIDEMANYFSLKLLEVAIITRSC